MTAQSKQSSQMALENRRAECVLINSMMARSSPKIATNQLSSEVNKWSKNDFTHSDDESCCNTARVCTKCISLKKLMHFGKKHDVMKKSTLVFFQFMPTLRAVDRHYHLREAVVYYSRLNNSERAACNASFKQTRKTLDASSIKIWLAERVETCDVIRSERKQKNVERMCYEFEAQGMMFEHEEGNCRRDSDTICKYCITAPKIAFIIVDRTWTHPLANAMCGYLVNILKNEPHDFAESILTMLKQDPIVWQWFKKSSKRYLDQIPASLVGFVAQGFALTDLIGSLKVDVTHNVNVPTVDVLVENVTNALTREGSVLPARCVGFLTMLFELCSNSSLASKIRMVTVFISSLDCASKLFSGENIGAYASSLAQVFEGMLNQIREMQHTIVDTVKHVFVAQGGIPFNESLFVGTMKLMAAMLPGVGNFDTSEQNERVRKLEMFSKAVTSWEKLFQFASKLFQFAYSAVCEKMYGIEGLNEQLGVYEEEICTWGKMVSEYYNNGGLSKVTENASDARTVVQWKRQADTYLNVLMRTKQSRSPTFMGAFRTVYAMIEKMFAAGSHFHVDAHLRLEPVIVYVFGQPGVGKSVAQNVAISMMMNKIDILTKRKDRFSLKKNVYTRNESEQYWSSYQPMTHRVVIFDDAFQCRDPEMMMQLAHDIVRMSNITQFPLNMADIDSKGVTHFESECIFMTSNVPPPTAELAQVVHSPEAIIRRLNVVIEQRVKPEYADVRGFLDVMKMRAAFPALENANGELMWNCDAFNDIYEFILRDGLTKKPLRTMNFDEYVNHLVDVYMTRRFSQQITLNTLAELERSHAAAEFEGQGLYSYLFPEKEEETVFFEADEVTEQELEKYLGKEFLTQQIEAGFDMKSLVEIYKEMKELEMPKSVANGSFITRKQWLHNNTKEIVNRFSNGAKSFVAYVREQPFVKYGMMLLGAIGLLFALYKLTMSSRSEETILSSEATVSGDEKTRYTKRTLRSEATTSGDDKTRQTRRALHSEATTSGDDKTRQTKRVLKSEGETVGSNLYRRLLNGTLNDDNGNLKLMKEFNNPDDFLEINAQASSDPNAIQLVQTRLRTACQTITVTFPTPSGALFSAMMRCIFIGGNAVICPAHLMHGCHDFTDGDLEFTNAHGVSRSFKFNEVKFDTTFDEKKDILVILLPEKVPASVNLAPHFHDEESLSRFKLDELFMFVVETPPHVSWLKMSHDVSRQEKITYKLNDAKQSALNSDDTKTIVNGLHYAMPTSKGECGTPLVWMNSAVQGGRILGFHIAGAIAGNIGCSNTITRQFVESILRKHKCIKLNQPDLDCTFRPGFEGQRAVNEDTGVTYCGQIDRSLAARMPVKSKIIPSLLHGVFPIETIPAPLSSFKNEEGVRINPTALGIKKMVSPPTEFPDDLVSSATAHLQHTILSMKSVYKTRGILTLDEAINGTGDKYIVPMDMHTSPGFPYTMERSTKKGASGKYAFVETSDGIRYSAGEDLKYAVEKRIECAKEGEIPFTLFVDHLKDERRPIEKAKAGKTRIFNIAPFDFNLVLRMYTSAFMAHIMQNHVHGEISVGMNPSGDEWGMMYKQFVNNGPNWIGGDYGSYDKTLSYQLLMKCADIINVWYDDGEENARVRKILFQTCFSAYHLVGADVYRVEQGNPSGIAMTAIINSMVNALMFRIVYMYNGGLITNYSTQVCVKFYGDDNLGTIAEASKDIINMRILEQTFARFGIEYTTPSKKAIDSDWLPFEEVTYLKRGFRMESGRVYAPLSMTSIREMMNWIRVSNDELTSLNDNWLGATREMFHHGREAYDAFTRTVLDEAYKRNVKLSYVDFVVSGMSWGCEDDSSVNTLNGETVHAVNRSCYLENNEETFLCQSKTCASINKSSTALYSKFVDFAVNVPTTMNNSTTSTENGLSAPNTVTDLVQTRNEILSFDDSSILTENMPTSTSIVPSIKVDPYLKETLTDFLSRTYYYNGTWPTSAVHGDLILRVHFPNFLFSVPQLWDKLKNFEYFRAGVKFGIRLNGSKFHMGNLLVSWSPQVVNTGTLELATNNVYTAASNPSFCVSPSENEVHEFTMPYTLPNQYIPLSKVAQSNYHIGCISIYCLNPLTNAATPTDVSFTLFANFVDVDIAGYTHKTYTIPTRMIENQSNHPAVIPVDPPVSTMLFEAQGKINRPNSEAVNKSKSLTVSGVAETIGNFAASLAVVPGIGMLAAGVSGVAGGISGIAKYFGYSLPNTLTAIMPVHQRYHNFNQTSGVLDTMVQAIDPENSVGSCRDAMGSTMDDMDILAVAQTPSLLRGNLKWSAANAPGTILFQSAVSPTALQYNDATNIYSTFLAWVTRPFAYWRGSIRVHMSIVCSQMHVGRLRITFVPEVTSVTAMNEEEFASCIGRVIDIEKETEIDFSIPYLKDQMWLSSDSTELINAYSNGTIVISVLNSLNHPNVPVPNCAINLWVSAGKDYQVARPSLSAIRNRIRLLDPNPPAVLFEAQGLTREDIRKAEAIPLIPATGNLEVGHTMGEIVTSIKEIIMRPCVLTNGDASVTTNYIDNIIYSPFAGTDNTSFGAFPTFIDYFKLMYRYSRGSFTTRLMTPAAVPFTTVTQTTTSGGGALGINSRKTFIPGNSLVVNGNAFQNIAQANSGGLTVAPSPQYPCVTTHPFYTSLPYHINFRNSITTVPGPDVFRNGTVPTANIDCPANFTLMVAAGDDWEYGFLVGPPIIAA